MNTETVILDDNLRVYDDVVEYGDGKAFAIQHGAHGRGRWLPVDGLFTFPRCPFRSGRRRYFVTGQPITRCPEPIVGGKFCLVHGGSMNWRAFLVGQDWTGPLSLGIGLIEDHRSVLQTFTAEGSAVHLFYKVPHTIEPNPYHPVLLAETASAGVEDLHVAWRRALGLFAATQ